MKTRKFLAVVLLLSMCFSFMTVSASADFNAHVDSGMFEEETSAPQEPETPSENTAEGETVPEDNSRDAVVVPDYEGEGSDVVTGYEGSIVAGSEVVLDASNTTETSTDNVVEVTSGGVSVSYTKWDDAMAAVKPGDTVKLLKSVGFGKLCISAQINLDLNGNSITITPAADKDNSKNTAIVFENGGTVKNGTITVETSYDKANKLTRYFGTALSAVDASLSIKNVTVDYEGEGEIFGGSVLVGKGCKLSKNPSSDYIEPGFKAEQNADGSYDIIATTPEAAKIGDKGYTYLTEALKDAKDGDVVLVLRDVNPPDVIEFKNYKANEFVVDLGGCRFTGNIRVAGGKSLTLKNGTVNGGIYTDSALTLGEGAKVGDIEINGGKLEMNIADAAAGNIVVGEKAEVAVSVSAGSVNSITSGLDADMISITGGTFAANPSEYVNNSIYNVTEDENGLFTVSAKPVVAKIGDTEYNSFSDALTAAADGDEIVLLADLKVNDFNTEKNLILNLNGKTLESNINVQSDMSLIIKEGTLNGNVTVKGGTAELQNAAVNTFGGYGTFKMSGSSKAAILSPESGELSISGSDVAVNELCLKDATSLTLNIEGGTFGAFTKADASSVTGNISGGVFGGDPSDYMAKGCFVEADKPEKGKFTVSVKEKATLTGPENTELIANGAEADMVFTCSEDITDEVYVNGEKLVNDAGNTRYAVDGNKLTLYKDYLNSLEAASYIVEVVPANNIEKAQAGFVVLGTPSLNCTAVPAVYVKGSNEALSFKSNYPIFKVTVDGKELGDEQFDYVGEDKKTISLKPEYLEKFTLDAENTLTVEVEITSTKQGTASAAFKRVGKAPATITFSDGTEVTEIKYYKDKNDADKNNLFFKVSPKVEEIKLDGKSLDKAEFQSKADSVKLSNDCMQALSAGRHKITFVFSNGAEKDIKTAVFPSYVFNVSSYTKGSGKDVKIILSDDPDSIWAGSSAEELDKLVYTSEAKDGKYLITIGSTEMDKLKEGTIILSFNYDDVSAMVSGFKVNPAPTIKPVDANKDCKWAYGSSTLSFNVTPDVEKVYVDNIELYSKDYKVSKENVLALTSSFLKSLEYGEHTLTVDTGEGEASIKFTTKCGIEAKNGNTHTKGGKKNLEFISSDPIKRVIVGSETLKADQYSLSKDGKTLVLKADFLNKLRADYTYELTVETDEGLAFTTFKILSPGSAASNPKTGDEGGMFIWAAVLILSGAGALALIPRRKKQ